MALLVCLVAFLAISQALLVNVTRCPSDLKPDGDWSHLTTLKDFYLAEVRPLQRAKQQTVVHVCYTDSNLLLKFDCIDDSPYSPFTQCNEPLFKGDVVEVFVTATQSRPGDVDLHHYLELEVSPNSVLFASHIANPQLTCAGIVGNEIPCSLIKYDARVNSANQTWWAYLSIPWSVINTKSEERGLAQGLSFFKANFFRIDSPLRSSKEYSAWQSPSSPTVPCFHVPSAFAEFVVAR